MADTFQSIPAITSLTNPVGVTVLQRIKDQGDGTQAPLVATVPSSGSVTTVQPANGTFTDRSGAVTTGGTSQQLAAANANRKHLIIQNPSTAAGQGIAAAESLFINFTTAAGVNTGASIELVAGAILDLNTLVTTEIVNVTAATSAHKWVAKEM